jgi:hypothetical protein
MDIALSGTLKIAADLAPGEVLRRVAAMCDELTALGAPVRVSVALAGEEDAQEWMKWSTSTPITVSTGLSDLAVQSTSNGADHTPMLSANGSLPAEPEPAASALPATTNGSELGPVQEEQKVVFLPWFEQTFKAQKMAQAITASGTNEDAEAQPAQAKAREMTTEEMVESVVAEIRRLAVNGRAPSLAQFVRESQAPVYGLMKRTARTWGDLVRVAGCEVNPRGGAKSNAGGRAGAKGGAADAAEPFRH